MVGLYLASTGEASGKSALCAALGRELKAGGKRVGYLKPVAVVQPGTAQPDKDAPRMKEILGLEEAVEWLSPVSISAADLAAAAGNAEPGWLKKVQEAYARASQGKDVVLLEGLSGLKSGSEPVRAAVRVAGALEAKAILLVVYESDLSVDALVAVAGAFGDRLLGVVVNAVPERRMERFKAVVTPALGKSGIKILGVLPEDRSLLTVTVGELAEHLGGRFVNNGEHSNDLVESVMVGALSFDSASYLNLRDNKAVITRGDRPDIQLVALNTSTVCLVLTDNVGPNATILSRAQELHVPVVVVDKSTTATAESLDGLLDRAQFHHEKKLERLGELLDEHFDLDAIYDAI